EGRPRHHGLDGARERDDHQDRGYRAQERRRVGQGLCQAPTRSNREGHRVVSGMLLEPGVMTRHPRTARWPVRDWGLIVCEAVTVTGLLATLVSLAGAGNVPRGPDPLPAGTVPRGAFAACARFVEGGGPSPSAGRANIEAWQWAR